MESITWDKTNRCWVFTFSLSANTVRAECVIDTSTGGQQVAGRGIGKETKPGAVGGILAAFEALEFIFGGNNG